MRRQYFNLTELLVIFVICILLFAFIFPGLIPGRSKTRHSFKFRCINHLKQIGTTIFMYAGDYDNTFPTSLTSNSVTTTLTSNAGGLNRLVFLNYLSDTTIYNCPSTTDVSAEDGYTITTLKTARTCSYIYAPGLMTGASDVYGNADSALVADMTSIASQLPTGNHDKYGNILFQGLHVKGFTGNNQEDWFLLNYGSAYDPITKKGSKDSSWTITGQYLY